MLASADNFAMTAAVIVGVVLLLGIGALAGSLASRSILQKSLAQSLTGDKRLSAALHELGECVEFNVDVADDLDSVTSLLANQEFSLPAEVRQSIQELLQSTALLSNRLERTREETLGKKKSSGRSNRRPVMTEDSAKQKPIPAADPEVSATALATPRRISREEFRDFPRSMCHGNLTATIYPPANKHGSPTRCTLLTRDLSCGGIGIAHNEPLVTGQMVVLDAVGTLLVGEVRWCRQLDEHFYIAGCKLVKTSE